MRNESIYPLESADWPEIWALLDKAGNEVIVGPLARVLGYRDNEIARHGASPDDLQVLQCRPWFVVDDHDRLLYRSSRRGCLRWLDADNQGPEGQYGYRVIPQDVARKSERLQLRLTPWALATLRQRAELQGVSMADIIEGWLRASD